MQQFHPSSPIRRRAFAVVYHQSSRQTFEARVDLTDRKVTSWKHILHAQPGLLADDYLQMQKIVRADARWLKAVRDRGIKNADLVQIDVWGAGSHLPEDTSGDRLWIGICYLRETKRNPYARPIGLIVKVNLDDQKVVEVLDSGIRQLLPANDFDQKSIGQERPTPKPLRIQQPQGPEFSIIGNEVRWQNWRFRFAVHPREGLVLYAVGYEDGDDVRASMHRASLSEMVVPYGDPHDAWFFRSAFDEGEYGLGYYTLSRQPGEDAPSNAVFRDVALAGNYGQTLTFRRAVAVYEQPGEILWRHQFWTEYPRGVVESRAARQLVVSYLTTLGNYDYGFRWIFHQDGVIEHQVLMTGVVLAKAVSAKTTVDHDSRFGTLIAANVEGVNNQHFFNYRLDMDIEQSTTNRVFEVNVEPVADPVVSRNVAFTMRPTVLSLELQARRNVDVGTARRWKVISTTRQNAQGYAVGYALVPGANAFPLSAATRKRAGFLDAHFWATAYQPDQLYAAGNYVNQSPAGRGLPEWTRANRSLDNKDVVVWYTMGVTHIPRPEEWPVMPVHKMGFKLVPWGFFDHNPALDIPSANSQTNP